MKNPSNQFAEPTSQIISDSNYSRNLSLTLLRSFAIWTLCLFTTIQINGQLFHENLLHSDNQLKFQEIIKQTEDHFDKIGRGKGNGYKQFQRWKYWSQRNLDENGQVRNSAKALKDHTAFKELNKTSSNRAIDDTYTELGPLSAVNTSTWSSGLGRVTAIGLDPSNASHIIVGAPAGGIWKTTNLGASWTALIDDQALLDVFSLEISHSNPNHYWAGLGGKIVRSVNGGATWSDATGIPTGLFFPIFNTIEMHPMNANILFAVLQSGIVFRSTDGGNHFTQVMQHTTEMYDLEFHPTNPSIIYASGRGAVYKSINGGASFFRLNNGIGDCYLNQNPCFNTIMMAVSPAAPSNLYMLEEHAGGFNALYLSSDEGNNWVTITSNACNCQNMMGYNLDEQSGQAPRDMDIVVSPTNPNIIHIAGIESWRTQNLGQSWSKTTFWDRPGQSDFIHADVDLLIYDNNRIVAGTDGGIYFSTNEATSWTDISSGLGIRQFYRIGASQTQADWVSGGSQDNGTGTLVSGTWYDWLGGDGMETFIDWSNENIMYGTTQNGWLYKSTDGGQTIANLHFSDVDIGNWVTPFEQDPFNSNTIYTARKDVWKSTDGGANWTILRSLPGLADEMKIAPSNNNYIYVSYGNTIYSSTNGGVSWSSVFFPALPEMRVNYIAVSPFDPAKLAIAISGSTTKIMESTNAGGSFTDISGNIPIGVGIECLTYDQASNGGLFAGGTPGIYYTPSTTSQNWEDRTYNLPAVQVTELEIRNEVLYVATYGRGLWKFGDNSCPDDLNLTVVSAGGPYEAKNTIISTANINSQNLGELIFNAGNNIDLKPGFWANASLGYTLRSQLDGCSN